MKRLALLNLLTAVTWCLLRCPVQAIVHRDLAFFFWRRS